MVQAPCNATCLLPDQHQSVRVLQACSRDGHEQPLAFQPAAKYAPIMDAVYKSLVDRSAHNTLQTIWTIRKPC